MSEPNVDAFKPPYLDKFLLILQVLGVIHIKNETNVVHVNNATKTTKKLRHIALVAYNTIILCSNIMMTASNIVVIMALNSGPKNFLIIVSITNNFMMYFWSVIAMTIMFILSLKSKLQSIRKPKNWISLTSQFEHKMPKHHLICYSVMVILIPSLMVVTITISSITADPQGLAYWSCFLEGSTSNFSGNNILNFSSNLNEKNITQPSTLNCALIIMFIFNMPSGFVMLIVPVYPLMWIGYSRQLFRGINSELKDMSYGDSLLLKRCSCQHWAVCGLIDKINVNQGCLMAWYVFSAVFIVFLNGYLVAKLALSGNSIPSFHIITYVAMITTVISLFYASCKLKQEVSNEYCSITFISLNSICFMFAYMSQ